MKKTFEMVVRVVVDLEELDEISTGVNVNKTSIANMLGNAVNDYCHHMLDAVTVTGDYNAVQAIAASKPEFKVIYTFFDKED